ncbi:hypothetical protein chiPu_0029335 [Chiloscyllium punctatum]|uniref:Uncharacterized protein n=1 Tax=Chiloscyllium punctatum TaxID=137246 RepID=A0A401TRJ4_CHIPU|nr:hypothetical protein [Chiloscyllium punctatum]
MVRGATSLWSTPRSIWRGPSGVGGPLAGRLSYEGAGAPGRVVLPRSPGRVHHEKSGYHDRVARVGTPLPPKWAFTPVVMVKPRSRSFAKAVV